jgi:hypothetical protein
MFLAGSQITMVGPAIVYWIYEYLTFFGYNKTKNSLTRSEDRFFYLMLFTFMSSHILNFYVWYITFIPLILNYITGGGMSLTSSHDKI